MVYVGHGIRAEDKKMDSRRYRKDRHGLDLYYGGAEEYRNGTPYLAAAAGPSAILPIILLPHFASRCVSSTENQAH